jgi:hypothetical protein
MRIEAQLAALFLAAAVWAQGPPAEKQTLHEAVTVQRTMFDGAGRIKVKLAKLPSPGTVSVQLKGKHVSSFTVTGQLVLLPPTKKGRRLVPQARAGEEIVLDYEAAPALKATLIVWTDKGTESRPADPAACQADHWPRFEWSAEGNCITYWTRGSLLECCTEAPDTAH